MALAGPRICCGQLLCGRAMAARVAASHDGFIVIDGRLPQDDDPDRHCPASLAIRSSSPSVHATRAPRPIRPWRRRRGNSRCEPREHPGMRADRRLVHGKQLCAERWRANHSAMQHSGQSEILEVSDAGPYTSPEHPGAGSACRPRCSAADPSAEPSGPPSRRGASADQRCRLPTLWPPFTGRTWPSCDCEFGGRPI